MTRRFEHCLTLDPFPAQSTLTLLFLTVPQHLVVLPQLLSAGGRVSLADMQPIINVDIYHIEKAAAEVVQEVRLIV